MNTGMASQPGGTAGDSLHNLQGQRLGHKGQTTRARIIDVARELIEDGEEELLTLSAVARRAGLRMSALYNYFADLPDLFLAVLEPVVAASEQAYAGLLREHWPDDELADRCTSFVHAFHAFWAANTAVLHMRNVIADQHDPRLMNQRIGMARVAIRLLGQQMGAPASRITGDEYDLASVLYTGLERVVTIATDDRFKALYPPSIKSRYDGKTLKQQARLLRLAIVDERAQQRETGAQS